jgi:radical SAM protein with 4Fe4S-binding SPASM domain
MPFPEAKAHLDAVAPRFLSLNGIGEPLLHPEWDRIVQYAQERHGAAVTFASTGVHFRDQAARLCESGLALVKVSFHGARPRTFARLASGRSLERVEDGIRALLAERARRGRGPEVRLNYVVSEESHREIPDAIAVAAGVGVEAVYFKGALVPRGRAFGLPGGLPHDSLDDAVRVGLQKAEERAIRTNLSHWRREVRRARDAGDQGPAPHGRCLIPWLSVFIRVDGTVIPCCNCTFRPDEGKAGRIGADGAFGDIWRGKRMAALRQEMRDGDYKLPICQQCPDPTTFTQALEGMTNDLWPGFLRHGATG